ncbi:MAG: hypothetical protein IPK37_13910 [Austwickia sp.]|jgi:hypothetical protein|nr:MAG: hypothetical protein IPK37_13910 [Austwickia sp.]
MTTAPPQPPAWHPLAGALLVAFSAVPALGALVAAGLGRAGAGPAIALTAYLAMGAIAGFSVSGST